MFLMLGDIHGQIRPLERALQFAAQQGITTIVQVGDFGTFMTKGFIPDRPWDIEEKGNFREQLIHLLKQYPDIAVLFIDGNHDNCTQLTKLEQPTTLFETLVYVPRGTVMNIHGKTVAFMGGAKSIDEHLRWKYGWFHDMNENIGTKDLNRMHANKFGETIDMFVTHVPPQSVIQRNFDPMDMMKFGVSVEWRDSNADLIEMLWNQMKCPVYSGHMHRSVSGEIDGKEYKILNIDEMIVIE